MSIFQKINLVGKSLIHYLRLTPTPLFTDLPVWQESVWQWFVKLSSGSFPLLEINIIILKTV